MFTFKTVSHFVIGIGMGLFVVAGYYAGHAQGLKTKFEDIWAQAQNLQRRLEVAEKGGEIYAFQAQKRIEYLEDQTLSLQRQVAYLKNLNQGLADDWKRDRAVLVDVCEELSSERQLLKCVNEFLNGIDPDAIEALREVR